MNTRGRERKQYTAGRLCLARGGEGSGPGWDTWSQVRGSVSGIGPAVSSLCEPDILLGS